jgi:hypothetical protein
MAGGLGNPLGARAMYLGETEYRIHGTNKPDTIGKRVSSGCIRLTNEDVADLYERVKIGAKVIVLPVTPPNAAGIAVEPAFDISAERAMSLRLEPVTAAPIILGVALSSPMPRGRYPWSQDRYGMCSCLPGTPTVERRYGITFWRTVRLLLFHS